MRSLINDVHQRNGNLELQTQDSYDTIGADGRHLRTTTNRK